MTNRRLIFGRVPANFAPEHDIVVAPWSFIGAESLYREWENMSFTAPFESLEERNKSCADTRRLVNFLVVGWAAKMNTRHGQNYSDAYWRDLMILWLLTAVQAFWVRYSVVEKAVVRFGDEALQVGVYKGKASWPSRDFEGFMERAGNDADFDFWMCSIIVRELAPPNWTLIDEQPSTRPGNFTVDAPNLNKQSWQGNIVRKVLGRLSFNSVLGVRSWRVVFSVLLNLLPKRTAASLPPAPDEAVATRPFPQLFLTLLDNFLEATLPASFMDDFDVWHLHAARQKYVPGRLVVDNFGTPVTANRFITAQAREAGERLVTYQHGAWYGSSLYATWQPEAEYNNHAFLTWGWVAQEDMTGNFVALPSPELSLHRNAHQFKDRRLILTGTRMMVRVARMDAVPSPPGWAEYRKMKKRFIGALAAGPRREFVYQPYKRVAATLEDEPYLRRYMPGIKILEGSLTQAMLGCRLLVLDHPGTSLNYAMAANVPTICFWNPEDWPLCRQATPFFEVLRENNMLFDCPEQAAVKINSIWDDVPGWWQSSAVQKARHQWCQHYARTSRWWWFTWARELIRLAKTDSIDGTGIATHSNPLAKGVSK